MDLSRQSKPIAKSKKAEEEHRLDAVAIEIALKLQRYPCEELQYIERKVKRLLRVVER